MQIKKTKAAILVQTHHPLVVDEVELPETLSFGQVLVKINYSGICGSQINEIEATKGPDRYLPHMLGHEGVGEVLEVGAGVRSVQPGDTVVLHWRPSDGLQSDPPLYRWQGQPLNAGWVTTFNQFGVISENRLTPIAEDFPKPLAPLFGCALTTAAGVVNNDAQIKLGQSVVVIGVGGVGLNIVQCAHMVSAHPIIGVDRMADKLDMATQFGATHVYPSENGKTFAAAIREIVGARGADVVIDTTGDARVIEQAYDLTHPNGKTILVGVPTKGDKAAIYTLPLHFKKILTGSHGGSVAPHVEIPRLVALWRCGKLTLDGLITDQYGLEEINTAIVRLKTGNTGRILITMD